MKIVGRRSWAVAATWREISQISDYTRPGLQVGGQVCQGASGGAEMSAQAQTSNTQREINFHFEHKQFARVSIHRNVTSVELKINTPDRKCCNAT